MRFNMKFKVTETPCRNVVRVEFSYSTPSKPSVLLSDLPAIPKGSEFRLLTPTDPGRFQVLEFGVGSDVWVGWEDIALGEIVGTDVPGMFLQKIAPTLSISVATGDIRPLSALLAGGVSFRRPRGKLVLEEID